MAVDLSKLKDLYISFKAVDIPEITVPKFDDSAIPEAMVVQGNLKTAVDNVKTKFEESPTFKGWSSSKTADTSTPTSTTKTSETTSSSTSSTSTADFIKKEEGFRDHRYKDANGQSIGYGFFGTTYYAGNHITREEADKVLDKIIKDQETNFAKYPVWNKLNDNQKTALHSYVYNVGSITKKLRDALISEDLTRIHDAMSIVTSGKKRNEGLVRRRNREKTLFNS